MSEATPVLHATTIALHRGGRWRGVLVQGPSGAGKSDLALRAMSHGWRLVADDRTLVWTSGGRLFGRAHPRLSGLIEARGLGIAPAPPLGFAELVLAVGCEPGAAVDRFPEPERMELLGVELPLVRLCPSEASAPTKLELALLLQSVRFDTCRNERIEPSRGRGDPSGAGAQGVRERNV